MATKKAITLPDKPSELIRLAIQDLEAVERSKKYVVNMSTWHSPDYSEKGKCAVCLAGSVMAKTLKCKPTEEREPYEDWVDETVEGKLQALDSFRIGEVVQGLSEMGEKDCENYEDLERSIVAYRHNPSRFKNEMLYLADDLEEQGL